MTDTKYLDEAARLAGPHDGLIERLEYTVAHGLFDAANTGKAASFEECLAAITSLQAELDSVRAASRGVLGLVGPNDCRVYANDPQVIRLRAALGDNQ